MSKEYRLAEVLNALAHFLVDAVCIAALFGAKLGGTDVAKEIIIYNTLAFSTQCVVGLLTDRVKRCAELETAAMLLVAAGFFAPVPLVWKVVMIGTGNSVFHVCGGTLCLQRSGGRAAPLGAFVAPGALGVALGRLWPSYGTGLAAALMVCAVGLFAANRAAMRFVPEAAPVNAPVRPQEPHGEEKKPAVDKFPLAAVAMLTAAVAVRAIGGSVVSYPWAGGALHVLLIAVFVFLGKAAGGYLCDRRGPVAAALVSILPAALLTVFFSASMPLSLAGQLLLNLSMPVTLWLLYRLMPGEPGFAFGLAASALWPGTVAGVFIRLTGPAKDACIIACFLLGLYAVYYSTNYLIKERKDKDEA